MSFKTDIEKIRTSVKGKDVINAIASGLENAYTESISKGNTDAEVVNARGIYNTLNARITAIETLMGVLANINVNEKTDFVSAINEIISNINRDKHVPWQRWIACEDLPTDLYMFGVGQVSEDYIYVWNGACKVDNSINNNSVFRYIISKNVWANITASGDFTAITGNVRECSSLSFIHNGERYVLSIGGWDADQVADRTQIIRVTKTGASIIAYLNYSRRSAACCYAGGKVYIIAGGKYDTKNKVHGYVNYVECLDLSTMQVSILAPLPITLNNQVTCATDGENIYIFESGISTNNNNFIYNIESGTYTTFSKHSKQRPQMRATYYQGYIILLGGYDNSTILWLKTEDNTWIDKSNSDANVKAWCNPVMDQYDNLYLIGGLTTNDSNETVIQKNVNIYLALRDYEAIEESDT